MIKILSFRLNFCYYFDFPSFIRIFWICLQITVWRLAQWRISEHKTVNIAQKLMRGKMLN